MDDINQDQKDNLNPVQSCNSSREVGENIN